MGTEIRVVIKHRGTGKWWYEIYEVSREEDNVIFEKMLHMGTTMEGAEKAYYFAKLWLEGKGYLPIDSTKPKATPRKPYVCDLCDNSFSINQMEVTLLSSEGNIYICKGCYQRLVKYMGGILPEEAAGWSTSRSDEVECPA